ncbi:MAG: isochorismate synthase MenF [Anaerolineae bacterium]
MLHLSHKSIPASQPAPMLQQALVSYTVPWDDIPLLDFLRLGHNAPRVYWETGKSPLAMAGFGRAAVISAHSTDRFQSIRRQADRLFEQLVVIADPAVPQEIGPKLFGGFAFNAGSGGTGAWSAFPAASFVLPQVQLTRWHGRSWLTLNTHFAPTLGRRDLLAQLRREIEALLSASAAGETAPPDLLATTSLTGHDTWCDMVSNATRRIRDGELDKVVLARARRMQFNRAPEPVDILTRLSHRYPDTYRFLFEPVPGHAFYGATPELLAAVDDCKVHTVAMAGSIARGQTPAEDDELGRQLLNNPKERHEHALVVDAIRENLGQLTATLSIPDQPALCKLSNIQHLETKIEGLLSQNCDILAVVEGLHPTPAVGGRPRPLALEIINQVEPMARGWYAAPVGWLDDNRGGAFSVAIRSAVTVGSESLLFAGAGIVADSVPENEWRETELKFRPLADALGGASPNGRT